jgi:Ca-activated chloride channel family protein
LPALQRALALPTPAGISRSMIVVTDGFVEADKQAMDYVRGHLGQANVFAFGIGSSVNRYLIEGLARAGLGEPFIVTEPNEVAAVGKRFLDYVRAPVLTGVRVAYSGFDAYDVEPRAVPDVLSRRPVTIFGKWRGKPQGAVTLSGLGSHGPYSRRFELATVEARPEDRALGQLWARARISALSDFGFGVPESQVQRDVTALGLRYNLLTRYTSFVAVSRVVQNPGLPASDVKQPLPLPRGVSQSAVGGELENASEPELFLLLAIVGALLLLSALRIRVRAQEQVA